MGTRQRLLVNQEGFTADTQSLNIPADNVKLLQLGFFALDHGGSATIAKLKANMDEVLVTLGGHNIVKMLFEDLVAYNVLALANYPEILLGGASALLCKFGGIKLPLHVTKRGRSLMTQVTFGTNVTELDTETLSIAYEYQDVPFPLHFAIQYEQKIGAANQRWEGLARVGAALQGLLIYNLCEDMATTTTVMPEIAELELIVDDRSVYEWNWAVAKAHHNPHSEFDTTDGYGIDAASGGLYDQLANHYKYIDFPEPWRADKIAIVTKNTCGAYTGGSNGTCRIIGIYNEL